MVDLHVEMALQQRQAHTLPNKPIMESRDNPDLTIPHPGQP